MAERDPEGEEETLVSCLRGPAVGSRPRERLGARAPQERLQDGPAVDAHAGDAGRDGHAAPDGRGHARSGYRFEAIPDGISVRTRGQGRVDLYVNHETGKVPFPYNSAAPTAANGENDFDNAQVSRLISTSPRPGC